MNDELPPTYPLILQMRRRFKKNLLRKSKTKIKEDICWVKKDKAIRDSGDQRHLPDARTNSASPGKEGSRIAKEANKQSEELSPRPAPRKKTRE